MDELNPTIVEIMRLLGDLEREGLLTSPFERFQTAARRRVERSAWNDPRRPDGNGRSRRKDGASLGS